MDKKPRCFICNDDSVKTDLTLTDLIADPILDTRVICGSAGLDKTIRWAQTSEVAEPWKWLGPEELLMTVGLNLPSSSEGQREFVRKVHAAGIVGMTIGEDGIAPPLTDAMLNEAEALGFPLLSTGPDTPFVVIARTVAAATAGQQTRSVLMLSRLYQAAGRQDAGGKRSGKWVADLYGTRIAVVDSTTGWAVIGEDSVSAVGNRAHALSTIRPTHLVVSTPDHVDALALVHLKQILSVDANVVLQEALNAVLAGETNLRLAVNGVIQKHDIDGGAWLAPDGVYRVIATNEDQHGRLAVAFALGGLRPLVARWKNMTIAVASGTDLLRVHEVMTRCDLSAGVSTEQTTFSDLSGAIEEARSALSTARTSDDHWSQFVGTEVSLLARSASEAEDIVVAVLGPMSDRTTSYNTLRESLFRLLDQDLQWQKTADGLGIHRQTLAYRMRKVETLTGRSVRRVKDLSELWLARSAWQSLTSE